MTAPRTYSEIVASQYAIKNAIRVPDLIAVMHESERLLLFGLIARAMEAKQDAA